MILFFCLNNISNYYSFIVFWNIFDYLDFDIFLKFKKFYETLEIYHNCYHSWYSSSFIQEKN
jgi:hypothetical protein